ncbi:MAG: cyclic nucleotide-binding domain-containing protein [Spirochaetia bacterium]|nr:cyclic nucleotide-binding domain-containing protein [Spirochaetia bacterium]
MDKQASNLLKGMYLFKDFAPKELEKLAKICKRTTYNAGERVFYETDEAHSMYIVEMGTLKLIKKGMDDSQEVLRLGSGAHFGEMPFLDGMARALTVEAMERTSLIEIPYEELRKLLEEEPKIAAHVYSELAHFLAARLRRATVDLTEARERSIRHF